MIHQQHTVTGGRVEVTGLQRYEGRAVDVVVKLHREQSSDPQRRYYFGVIVATLAEFCGYDRDEMHAALKWKFLRYTDRLGLDRVPSYRELDTAAAERYHDDVRRWAVTEYGVNIPEPNEVPVEEYELN